jgi:triosephosphate isomerase
MLHWAVPVIAGNWKMNKGPVAATQFVREFTARYTPRDDRTVILFPPSLSFTSVVAALDSRPDVRVGVQNIHWETEGAFTGEVSASMAREARASFVLIGHSERRQLFGEKDEHVRKKLAATFQAELNAIVCVGETLAERKAGHVEAVITQQLDEGTADLSSNRLGSLLVAYEPVWAIGTGVNASPKDASAAHAVLRANLRARFGENGAAIPILYGGSVKPSNARELLQAPDVNGLLIGGTSLDPAAFAEIAEM